VASGPTKPLDTAASRLVNAGVSLFLGAGNDYQYACDLSPQRVKSTITVGASYSGGDAMTDWSGHGKCVDIYAPGKVFVA
jgi:serine protease